jgi:hypothetical protein
LKQRLCQRRVQTNPLESLELEENFGAFGDLVASRPLYNRGSGTTSPAASSTWHFQPILRAL